MACHQEEWRISSEGHGMDLRSRLDTAVLERNGLTDALLRRRILVLEEDDTTQTLEAQTS